jgi:type VI secretion system protein ImpF
MEMSRGLTDSGLMPTLLDRLIDVDRSGPGRRSFGVEQFLAAVRRDLEALLNTRPTADAIPESFHEVRTSILNYGLPDLTYLPASTPQQRAQIGKVIKDAILRYDPRLRDVEVRLIESSNPNSWETVRFQIDGKLVLDPSPDVRFATLLNLETGRASVKSDT